MKKTHSAQRKIIWILGFLSTITPFAIDLYLPAFAQLALEFGTNTATVSLSVSSYFIGMAIGQILYGPFLDRFGRKPPLYAGLIGGGQVNILLTRKFNSEQIFQAALIAQVSAGTIFLIGITTGLFGLYGIIAMFFICLSCLGLTNPNGNALALAPFTRTVGSASALLGFVQIGVASMMSAGVGLFNINNATPSVALMCVTSVIALVILLGRR